MSEDPFDADDLSLIAAHDGSHAFDAVVPPIAQTSLFTFGSYAEMRETFLGRCERPVYTRGINPTTRIFEEKLAAMEGAQDAMGFASGMAAISSTLLAFLAPGDRLVAVRHIYPDAYRLFEILFRRLKIDVVYVDGRDPDAVEAALRGARLLYLESPTSWVMQTHNVAVLAALARKHGVLSVIDNSWATPVFQRPIGLGVDLVIHSASKYLGGHSDVVAGVVAGSKELIREIRAQTYPYLGAKLSPFDAWLLVRGLRTLPIRMKAHEAAALEVASHLVTLDDVESVEHPALAGALPPGLSGTSGLFSVTFRESIDIPTFADALKLFKLGVSWGGHESLCVPGQVVLSQNQGPNSGKAFGISPQSIRLHVGLEGSKNLIADLDAAISLSRRFGH